MTESNLYKFVKDFEMRWIIGKLLVWIPICKLQEFIDLTRGLEYADGGLVVNLQSDYVCVDIVSICEDCGVDPENILKPEEKI